VPGLGHAAHLPDGPRQTGGAAAAVQRPDQLGAADGAQLEGARDAQQVVPVLGDQPGIDPVAGDPVERPVVGGWVDPPEAGVAQIGQPGTELVAQQPEEPEDEVAVYVDTSRGSFGLSGGGEGLAEVSEEVLDASGGGVVALHFA
jgi:hypothetical protein